MINHVSIGVYNPEKVAHVIAEIWDGYVLPFPPSPNSFVVLADDGQGSAVEVMPINIVMVPGRGLPPEEYFDEATPTEEYEAKFMPGKCRPPHVSTHLALNTNLTEQQVKTIARRENWRALTCNRIGGLMQLIEVWVENRLLLEVFTPEMAARYTEIANPQFMRKMLGLPVPAEPEPASDLNLIG